MISLNVGTLHMSREKTLIRSLTSKSGKSSSLQTKHRNVFSVTQQLVDTVS